MTHGLCRVPWQLRKWIKRFELSTTSSEVVESTTSATRSECDDERSDPAGSKVPSDSSQSPTCSVSTLEMVGPASTIEVAEADPDSMATSALALLAMGACDSAVASAPLPPPPPPPPDEEARSEPRESGASARECRSRQRRLNEEARIRHFGWSLVLNRSRCAQWHHPVHGMASSLKAALQVHAHEPPLRCAKWATADTSRQLSLVQGGVPMASLRHAMTMAPMRAASMPMPMPVVQVAPVQLSMLAPVHEVYALAVGVMRVPMRYA